MKLTFKLPQPEHHPAAAYEFLTQYGFVEYVDPLGEVTYSLEGESMTDLAQMVLDIEHEANCYDWWNMKLNLYEQAQVQLDRERLGQVQLSLSQVKALSKLLQRVERFGSITPTFAEKTSARETLALLEQFEPLQMVEVVRDAEHV